MQASRRRKKPKRTTAVLQFLMWVQLRHCGKAASGSTESAEGVTMNIRRLPGLIVLFAFAFTLALHAQDTGVITGTVRDSSGAVVSGADVKIYAHAGGNDRTTVTNSDGEYLAAGLPGGTYDLTISAKGFKTFQAKDVVLRVAQKARVDATLGVGQATTEVLVTGE